MKGVSYEVANGDEIPNLGEKRCIITTEEASEARPLTMQVCDVHKSLLSIDKIIKAGKRVVFDAETNGGPFIRCRTTGEKLKLNPDCNL